MRHKYKIDFNNDKNLLLKETRGICFDDVAGLIREGKTLANINHKSRVNQRIFIIKFKGYVYSVPYTLDRKRKIVFLKTVYPSRDFTKVYLSKI